jgi:hypothetical protein
MKVTGIKETQKKLKELKTKYSDVGEKPTVVVGFTQQYAVFVHEDLEAYHAVGQAKYLEQPARELGSIIGELVGKVIKKGGTFIQGLLIGGLRLQREAQLLTPVDTSALKASAFTATEQDYPKAAQEAFEKSETIRKAAADYKKNPLVQAVMRQSNKYERGLSK